MRLKSFFKACLCLIVSVLCICVTWAQVDEQAESEDRKAQEMYETKLRARYRLEILEKLQIDPADGFGVRLEGLTVMYQQGDVYEKDKKYLEAVEKFKIFMTHGESIMAQSEERDALKPFEERCSSALAAAEALDAQAIRPSQLGLARQQLAEARKIRSDGSFKRSKELYAEALKRLEQVVIDCRASQVKVKLALAQEAKAAADTEKSQRLVLEVLKLDPNNAEAQMIKAGGGAAQDNKMALSLANGVSMDLVWCPEGTFLMGSPEGEAGRYNDETQHRVTLTKGFWMGRTEVTQAQWEAITGSNPSRFKGADLPVEGVSWDDCQAFIMKLNAKLETGSAFAKVTGDKNLKPGKFRFPTEAEWEYACRAGTSGSYAGSLNDMGWHAGNSGSTTHAVSLKKPNAWGLYDMHGNVWEFCQDWYGEYALGSVTDPAGSASGAFCVLRGGGSNYAPRNCRSAIRGRYDPGYRYDYLGLRLARSPVQ